MSARTSCGPQVGVLGTIASLSPPELCDGAGGLPARGSWHAPRVASQRDDWWQGRQATISGTGEPLNYGC